MHHRRLGVQPAADDLSKLDTRSRPDQIVVNAGPFILFFRGWEHKWGATLSGGPAGRHQHQQCADRPKGSGFYFGGTVDDVRVWQDVLSARDIANVWAGA